MTGFRQVQGLSSKDSKYRDSLLIKNIGKYSQWSQPLSHAIGDRFDVTTSDLRDLTNGESLSIYTYNTGGSLSNLITSRYNIDSSLDDQYSIDTSDIDTSRWKGDYSNYLDYVDKLFSEKPDAFKLINEILTGHNIKYALQDVKTGAIDDIDVAASMRGEILTNPATSSTEAMLGTQKDSKLGIIGNFMYSNMLYYGSEFNTVRGRGGKTGDTSYPYITPYLYTQYGNNSSNVFRLSDILNIDQRYGRVDDSGLRERAKIIEYEDARKDIEANSELQFLDDQIYEAIKLLRDEYGIQGNGDDGHRRWYTPESGSTYSNVDKDSDGRFTPITPIDQINGNKFKVSDTNIYGRETDDAAVTTGVINTYNEGDTTDGGKSANSLNNVSSDNNALVTEFDTYKQDESQYGVNNLIEKTNKLFNSHKIRTLVARFHTSEEEYKTPEMIDTARSRIYGNSHGRNLLKYGMSRTNANANNSKDFNYSDPYCRVWTYHHQYQKYKDAIRPFIDSDNKAYSVGDIQDYEEKYRARFSKDPKTGEETISNGGAYLANFTVLQDNGLVRITPTIEEYAGGEKTADGKLYRKNVKNYMFSIENLAWKGYTNNLTREQTGPNRGRIMWFPPYDLAFQESVEASWNPISFIGRGEKIYTYTDTTRTATLSFTLLIDHPSLINQYRNSTGSEGDPDADLLRFFAGCRMPDIPATPQYVREVPPQTPPQIAPPEGNKIIFCTFFPNNYSGNLYTHGTTNSTQRKRMWEKNGYMDDDWWIYLLIGKNVESHITESELLNTSLYRGYEMKEGSGNGVSVGTKTGTDYQDFLYAAKTKQKADWTDRENINPHAGRRFKYRVDCDLAQHMLTIDEQNSTSIGKGLDSYSDKTSFGLNASLTKLHNTLNNRFDDCNYSFAEVILALEQADDYSTLRKKSSRNYVTIYNNIKAYAVSCGARESAITQLVSIFSDTNQNYAAGWAGEATRQDLENTKALQTRRDRCLKYTIKGYLSGRFQEEKEQSLSGKHSSWFDNTKADLNGNKNMNTATAKGQRNAFTVLEFSMPTIEKEGNDVEKNTVVDSEGGVTTTTTTNDLSTEDQEKNSSRQLSYVKAVNNKMQYDDAHVHRYDNEYEFFQKLQVTDPVIFKRIVDKIKYFDPAFHSMTPEGFNARLNFLHQCTRQGHTVSASEVTSNSKIAATAGNLAFGRMPVCVLRIGDFINTRCVINSMQIDYSGDGMQWDLNPEGAGVQPMFAKVSMNMVLFGGMALNAPINRLQNAQTFNYYANTGVYDNRADRVDLDTDTGDITYVSLFNPNPTTITKKDGEIEYV